MTIEEMKNRKNQLGYSNKKLSEISGVPEATIAKIFAGITSHPRYNTLQALSAALEDADSADGRKTLIREKAPIYGSKTEYTLKDYLELPDDEPRMELIDGTFYDMGQPTLLHQSILVFLLKKVMDHIYEHQGPCIPFLAPVAVQLDCDDKTVVEPDLIVVCDRSKFQNGRIMGAPDFVVEVLSPSTRKKDMGIKTYKYQNAGVREYWIIDPKAEKILVYDFEGETFPAVYGFNSLIPVKIWQGECVIDLNEMNEYCSFLK